MRLLLKLIIIAAIAYIAYSGGKYIFNTYNVQTADKSHAGLISEVIFLQQLDTIVKQPGYVAFNKLPPMLIDATIASEDNRFYQHFGVDIEATVRAALVNLQAGEVVQGGSTINQQLAKNVWLDQQTTLNRKLIEALFAIDMNMRLSKQEIIALYINTVYYGADAYGISAASKTYFNKKPSDLSLSECAMLAGLPNAPSLISPYVNPVAAKNRQLSVLNIMESRGYIDSSQALSARSQTLTFANGLII